MRLYWSVTLSWNIWSFLQVLIPNTDADIQNGYSLQYFPRHEIFHTPYPRQAIMMNVLLPWMLVSLIDK